MKHLILATIVLPPLFACGGKQIVAPPVLEDAGGSGYVDVSWYGIDISFTIDASVEGGVEACVEAAGGWVDYCSVFVEVPEEVVEEAPAEEPSEGSGESP